MADNVFRIVTLTKPITAYEKTVTELKLRKPTPAELRRNGQPYSAVIGGGGGVQADYRACFGLIEDICAIPGPSVDQLDGADFDQACMILVGFTRGAAMTEPDTGSGSTSSSAAPAT